MVTLQMNARLLSIICTVQTAMDLFLSETKLALRDHPEVSFAGCRCYSDRIHPNDDHLTRTRRYFFDMSDEVIEAAGLAKTEECFCAICVYQVTPEMRGMPFNNLSRYEFSYTSS